MKYRNTKILVDGFKFDSKEEAAFYLDLKEMVSDGEVINFTLQPKVILVPSFKKYGRTIRAITYSPDFYVEYSDGRQIYIDVKGFETESSKLRKKLFDFYNPTKTLLWLTRNKKYGDKRGWIEKEELSKIIRRNRKEAKEKLK